MNLTVVALLCGLTTLALFGHTVPGVASADQPLPPELRGIRSRSAWVSRLRCRFPRRPQRAQVKLADYFTAKRPVIVVLNYYSCPTPARWCSTAWKACVG